MIQLFVFSVCAALILMVVKDMRPEYSTLGGILVTLTIGCACVDVFADLLTRISNLTEYGVSEYVNVMLKVAGVCICVDVSSEMCADCGYSSVAKSVLMYGKAQLLIIVFPYIQRLISGVSSLF